jgi:hypothetical protein
MIAEEGEEDGGERAAMVLVTAMMATGTGNEIGIDVHVHDRDEH